MKKWIVFLLVPIVACTELFTEESAENELLDGPIDGLSNTQMRVFLKGDAAFGEVFTPETGLGPYFVTASCVSCHPGDGKGHPFNQLTRFGKQENGQFDHMLLQGGPQLQHRSIAGFEGEVIPSGATGVSHFVAPAVTGLGYLEAVRDEEILLMADPDDLNGDGISGVPNYQKPPDYFRSKPHHIPDIEGRYIGRFGKKAGAIDLLIQTVGAYKQDMGITSEFDMEDPINYATSDLVIDNVDGPEVATTTINQVLFYLQTLKAPIRRNINALEVLEGERIFNELGCESCHRSVLETGSHNIEALSNKVFYPYTDLLMHDMGVDLDDGYTEGTALTNEWKTPALWGLGLSKDAQGGGYFLLHDGRAKSIEEAIEWHGGEGQASSDAFSSLSPSDRASLITFLESL